MTLPPPEHLASALADRYSLEGELGSGGMATVYLAHDVRHHRKVALKVLSPELMDSIGSERFLAEIRTTANLQHPHILGLIDSGQANGHVYYVMPLVQGESVRARLRRERQLPVEDAVRIAREVALALDYAHRQGVIHRDIKPENILLQDGQAMVADFGIALAVAGAESERLTHTGISVGTPQYMSPEQAMGDRQLTARSDIYALGCVLYEMLSGEPPHSGPTAQAVTAKVMTSEPAPLSGLRPSVPRHVTTAVHVALRKVAADRFNTAHAFAEALAGHPGFSATSLTHDEARTEKPSRQNWKMFVSAAAFAAAGVIVGWMAKELVSGESTAAAALQLAYLLPEGTALPPLVPGLALSPDGTTIVYSTASGDPLVTTGPLYLKRFDEPTGRPLPGTESAVWPFFSPDGRSVGFFAKDGLKSLSLSDGSTLTMLDSALVGGAGDASWADGAFILYGYSGGARLQAGIKRLSVKDGTVEILTRIDSAKGETNHFAPQQLPGTRTLLYTMRRRDGATRVVARSLDGGEAQTLIDGASRGRYVGDGRLMFQVGTDVFVSAFNPRTLRFSGSRTRIVSDAFLVTSGSWWAAERGMLVYRPSVGDRVGLAWVSRTGASEALPLPPDEYGNPSISPGGDRVALDMQRNRLPAGIGIVDLGSNIMTRLSSTDEFQVPIWTPDGARLTVVRRSQVDGFDLYSIPADGSPARDFLLHSGTQVWPAAWARDGTMLVVMGGGDLWTLGSPGDTTLRPLVNTSSQEWGGRISPNGRWLAYFLMVAGRYDLFVTPFPKGGPRWKVSRDGAREAVWSRDGRELFFRNGRQMLSATIRPGVSFAFDPPRVLFEGNYRQRGGPGNVLYDISPDGNRFLMFPEAPIGPPRLQVVQGWDRLGRQQPGRGH